MAALVIAATSEKLAETDWIKNIEICELVAHDKKYPTKLYFRYATFKFCGIINVPRVNLGYK